MSYDALDAARDEMYENISELVYPEHKAQAIGEFTSERLRSFYVANPKVMSPAVNAIQEGKRLIEGGFASSAVVCFVTAIEVLLKATLLKPVVHGLVHYEGLANVIVEQALGQSGFDRYSTLLARLFSELINIDIHTVKRSGSKEKLLVECTELQRHRNRIIHQGAVVESELASQACAVAVAVYELVVFPMLMHLGLQVIDKGEIQLREG